MEAALSLEKIRNAIFSFLEPQDLLQCRLVSKSGLQMATDDKLLNKKIVIQIEHNSQKKDSTSVIVKGQKRRLKDVRDFVEGLGPHSLPCSASMILKTTIHPNDYLKFLDPYGFVIISLDLTFHTTNEVNGKIFVYHMDSLLEFVTKLLTEQLPNLETLEMKLEANAKFAGKIDPQLVRGIRKGIYFPEAHNHCLRSIRIGHSTPFEIIDAVCCLAPKLEELLVDDWEFWVKNKHRLYLLKTLNFQPTDHHWDHLFNNVEAVVISEEKVSLKKLKVNFCDVADKPELWPGVANLLTKVLEKSFDSLEELHLYPLYFLPGTVLPKMPKVKLLYLDSCDPLKSEWRYLPQGASMSTTFPNLHTIDLRVASAFPRFLSLCGKEEFASMRNVKIVFSDTKVRSNTVL